MGRCQTRRVGHRGAVTVTTLSTLYDRLSESWREYSRRSSAACPICPTLLAPTLNFELRGMGRNGFGAFEL
jgi:hypothetical protein